MIKVVYPLTLDWPLALDWRDEVLGLFKWKLFYNLQKAPPVFELPSSKYKQIPSVDVWKNMTVQQLAEVLGKDCGRSSFVRFD